MDILGQYGVTIPITEPRECGGDLGLRLIEVTGSQGPVIGGIGTGGFEKGPYGFKKFFIGNVYVPEFPRVGNFSIYIEQDSKQKAYVLSEKSSENGNGLESWDFGIINKTNVESRALFPFYENCYSSNDSPVQIKILSIAPIIPGDEKVSCTPAGIYKVIVTNTSKRTAKVAAMISWPNIVGAILKKEKWDDVARRTLVVDNEGNHNIVKENDKSKGIAFRCSKSSKGSSDLHGDMTIAIRKQPGIIITTCSSFDATEDGNVVWGSFSKSGVLLEQESALSVKKDGLLAAAIAAKFEIKAGESREVEIVMAWNFEKHVVGDLKEYSKRYREFYPQTDSWEIASIALDSYPMWIKKIKRWQKTVLEDPYLAKLSDIVNRDLLNSSYILVALSIWTKDGLLTIREGADFWFYSSLDVMAYVWLICMLFPDQEKKLITLFANWIDEKDDRLTEYENAFPITRDEVEMILGMNSSQVQEALGRLKEAKEVQEKLDEVKGLCKEKVIEILDELKLTNSALWQKVNDFIKVNKNSIETGEDLFRVYIWGSKEEDITDNRNQFEEACQNRHNLIDFVYRYYRKSPLFGEYSLFLGPMKSKGIVLHDLSLPLAGNVLFTWRNTNRWKDLNSKFVLAVYRAYLVDGEKDTAFLKRMWPNVVKALEHLHSMGASKNHFPVHEGGVEQTYDDIMTPESSVSVYCAGLWLVALETALKIADILGINDSKTNDISKWLKSGKNAFLDKFWNEKGNCFYTYFVESNTGEIENRSTERMSDQLLWQWYIDLFCLPQIVNPEYIEKTLQSIYKYNYKDFHDGRIGIVNMTNEEGGISTKGEQYQQREIWVGPNYVLVCLMLSHHMLEEAQEVYLTLYNTIWNEGYAFGIPEAISIGDFFSNYYDEDGKLKKEHSELSTEGILKLWRMNRAAWYSRPAANWALLFMSARSNL